MPHTHALTHCTVCVQHWWVTEESELKLSSQSVEDEQARGKGCVSWKLLPCGRYPRDEEADEGRPVPPRPQRHRQNLTGVAFEAVSELPPVSEDPSMGALALHKLLNLKGSRRLSK